MATVKAKIKVSDAGGFGRVYFQIIHKRVVRRILTDVWCRQPDIKGNSIVSDGLRVIESIISALESAKADYDSGDVVRRFLACKDRNTFEEYFRKVIARLDKEGRSGGKKAYKSTLASFQRFSSGMEHRPGDITSQLMDKYQNWLICNGLMANSVSFYMRNIRAVYRLMVREGLTCDSRPFVNAFTGIAKTRKRAITEDELKLIKGVNLSDYPKLEFTRDIFMLSFYCMGMPFVDIAFLRKECVRDGRIIYNRQKTGQTIDLRINIKIRSILDKYPSRENSPYLLPIITRPGQDERTQYENVLRYANKNLKMIADLANVRSGISTYTPRHTWASIAKLRQVNISTISDALGHENESTTQIYLATLDNSHVDMANELITEDF